MAFNFLQSKLEKSVSKAKTRGILNEENINEVLEEIKLVLLDSDVNLKVVNSFTEKIKESASGRIVNFDRSSSQVLLKIINEELISLLGGEVKEWKSSSPAHVMLVGLQGSGKTTTTAKLASHLVEKGKYKKPLLVGLDIYRPAAIDQLETLSTKLKYDFFANRESKNVQKISYEALKFAKANDNDLILFDTAGRLQTDDQLMKELEQVKKTVKPSEIIFVADAMSGQEIINVAQTFHDKLKLTSTIVTKLDSNARGGATLSIISALDIPMMFMGVGERITDLEKFYPKRMASRLLGLGDIETLTEKTQAIIPETKQERLMRRIISGQYDLTDLLESMQSVNQIGSLGSIAKMMPGVNISDKQSDSAQKKMNFYTILINSMTRDEKRSPSLLKQPKRKTRILKGSGRTAQEYNDLLRTFEKSQKQMKQMGQMLKSGVMPKL